MDLEMVQKFTPNASKVYFISKNVMYHILEGEGSIQVDFKNYQNWDNKLIFLEKGQYIRFLSDDFLVRKIEFDQEDIFRNDSFRVLFKHLISIGYINFEECIDCQRYLESSIISSPDEILDVSAKQWYWQNPFRADTNQYHIIFDVKEIIDKQFRNHLNNEEIVRLIGKYDVNPQSIFTEKVGMTIKSLLGYKRLAESKKEIAFTDKSIKEIAYDFGYNDPSYFNKVFRNNTGYSALEFRNNHDFVENDTFISSLYQLVGKYHEESRTAGFYADELNMSVKTLSKKVRNKLQTSIGQLIRQEIIKTAKNYLRQGLSVKEISLLLHFEEANHFSAFFKRYTGFTPSEFLTKKLP